MAGTYFKYKFCLKRCDLILFTWNKLLPSRFKLTDLLLWQQLQDELRRTKQSKIKWNRQQSNPANWVSDVRRTDPKKYFSWIKGVIQAQCKCCSVAFVVWCWLPQKIRSIKSNFSYRIKNVHYFKYSHVFFNNNITFIFNKKKNFFNGSHHHASKCYG